MDNLIYFTLIDNGFTDKAARNIVAQARLETNDYTSANFKKYNNLFGYGYSGSKWQLSKSEAVKKVGEPSNWAIYKTPKESVMEIVDYWKRRKNEDLISSFASLEDTAKFAELLKVKGYYTAKQSDYTNGLKNNLKDIVIDTSAQNNMTLFYLFFFA